MLTKLSANQLRKPSHLMGNLVIAPIRNRGNAVLNDYVYERLNLRSEDRMLEIGFGGGYLLGKMVYAVTEGCIVGVDRSQTIRYNLTHISTS